MRTGLQQSKRSIAALAGLCLAAGLALSLPAGAAQVGTAMVNGKMVILDDNGTWRYKEGAAATQQTCDVVDALEVCIAPTSWRRQTNKTENFTEAYETKDGSTYVGIVSEPFGTSQGYTFEGLQKGIVANMALVMKVDEAEIPVLDVSETVKGFPGFRSITYSGTVNSLPVVFHNIYRVTDKRANQVAFWTIGKTMTPEFQAKIDEFLAVVKSK